MTAQLDALDFVGEPFDALAWTVEEPVRRAPASEPPRTGDPVSGLLQDFRADLIAAHTSAMAVQTGLQRHRLAALGRPAPTGSTVTTATAAGAGTTATTHPESAYTVTLGYSLDAGLSVAAGPRRPDAVRLPAPEPASTMSAFKALARTPVTALDESALAELAHGAIANVLGTAYDQEGVNPAIRLAACENGALTGVSGIERHGGPWNRGQLRASYQVRGDGLAAAVEVVWQAAQVFAIQTGLHLCLAGARFETVPDACEVELVQTMTAGELTLDVVQIDLLPRPWLRVNAELRRDGTVVARVRDLTLRVREEPGTPVGPEAGGVIPRFFGRRNGFGQRALLGEFHMTHSARGDLAIALGPEFARYAGRRATRMPNHGLQLCDRVMAVDGERGNLTGATGHTEYDSPADSWYYKESANASMPNVVYMETSLQSALLLGYFLGATLTAPEEDYCLRNLDGTATVLREVDLRDKTIQQTSRLLNTTVLVGAVLQTFSYELSVDGEPFYAGESLFGFFNETALANQNGLDNGAYVPPWLDTAPQAARTIDVAARRGDALASSGHLALLDSVTVVDGGGKFGAGYLHAVRPIRADDWFFAYHFHLDPVMPGSLGVEAVIQAMQEWAIDAGLADGLREPEFVLPAELPMSWRYRGQILAEDREMTVEVHLKNVERRPGRVRVTGEASVWKPGLRIYELTGVAVELREPGARPW
ncbi:beta-ketoacyl synthase [Amycolatopsis pithecellobii]|uniref:Beta-ketoacyl synthase n=1 Tax=Amycolatopsis pithecellobii TaxID=664692 RepID=A0A6N7Z360_9PSEU|nr:beta-ketoacyl synthase [Amycolatopsis pithecellobii]MTD54404.1 beta-ketoacyl synthase [Amycolatopsis pithecellobii]